MHTFLNFIVISYCLEIDIKNSSRKVKKVGDKKGT